MKKSLQQKEKVSDQGIADEGGFMRFRQTFIARVFLITVFLVFLAAVLKGMGWAIGGICEACADIFLK